MRKAVDYLGKTFGTTALHKFLTCIPIRSSGREAAKTLNRITGFSRHHVAEMLVSAADELSQLNKKLESLENTGFNKPDVERSLNDFLASQKTKKGHTGSTERVLQNLKEQPANHPEAVKEVFQKALDARKKELNRQVRSTLFKPKAMRHLAVSFMQQYSVSGIISNEALISLGTKNIVFGNIVVAMQNGAIKPPALKGMLEEITKERDLKAEQKKIIEGIIQSTPEKLAKVVNRKIFLNENTDIAIRIARKCAESGVITPIALKAAEESMASTLRINTEAQKLKARLKGVINTDKLAAGAIDSNILIEECSTEKLPTVFEQLNNTPGCKFEFRALTPNERNNYKQVAEKVVKVGEALKDDPVFQTGAHKVFQDEAAGLLERQQISFSSKLGNGREIVTALTMPIGEKGYLNDEVLGKLAYYAQQIEFATKAAAPKHIGEDLTREQKGENRKNREKGDKTIQELHQQLFRYAAENNLITNGTFIGHKYEDLAIGAAVMHGAKFIDCELHRCKFRGAYGTGILLRNCVMCDGEWRGIMQDQILDGTHLYGVNMRKNDFRGMKLSGDWRMAPSLNPYGLGRSDLRNIYADGETDLGKNWGTYLSSFIGDKIKDLTDRPGGWRCDLTGAKFDKGGDMDEFIKDKCNIKNTKKFTQHMHMVLFNTGSTDFGSDEANKAMADSSIDVILRANIGVVSDNGDREEDQNILTYTHGLRSEQLLLMASVFGLYAAVRSKDANNYYVVFYQDEGTGDKTNLVPLGGEKHDENGFIFDVSDSGFKKAFAAMARDNLYTRILAGNPERYGGAYLGGAQMHTGKHLAFHELVTFLEPYGFKLDNNPLIEERARRLGNEAIFGKK